MTWARSLCGQRKIFIDDFADDGRGGRRSFAAVFRDDDNRDPGIIGGRVSGEPGMWLAGLEHLGGAGLARDNHLRSFERRVRRAVLVGRHQFERIFQ